MGIPGVTVTLTGEEDRDPENTNADGQFGFTGLAAGDYTLTISEYDAVEYAFEPTREFALELDGAEIMNFTGRALRTATVMGYVTVEDAPLPGIGVTLIMVVGTSGEIVGATATGDDGGYTFGPLLAGAYLVRHRRIRRRARFCGRRYAGDCSHDRQHGDGQLRGDDHPHRQRER